MYRIIFSSAILFLCACKGRTDVNEPRKDVSVQWQYLAIEFDDTVIQISQGNDTLEVITFNMEVQKYPIGKEEENSLFILANELMGFNGQPEKFCTDYVGKLKVRIGYNQQLSKEVSFSSICDWRKLNANTNRIDQFLMKIAGANNLTAP